MCIRDRYNPALDAQRLFRAFTYADNAHAGQLRKDGSPYITHPLAVAEIVAELELDTDSIIAALLHDCIEDTGATHEEIAKLFGPTVADLVEGVTKLTRVQYTSKEEEQMENLRKMLMAMAKDIRVILIKICDRLHNMRTMEYQSARKQKEKALETMEIYAPIAHRLGMQRIKWELEDTSLQYLDPIGYREIADELAARSSAHEEFLAGIQKRIQDRLDEEGIRCTIYGRVKHIYSIYRKMYTQNKTMDEIFDLYAFRVIVDDMPECYNVLGVIHDLFNPVLGRFKDYISTPKPNGYQSLHTTVIGREGIPFEVQIRTWEMHHTAEYGIAAHWKYKQGMANAKLGTEEAFEWVRKLLESQQDVDAEEFVRTMRVDLFADEVFVFTPRGDVINLPAGATPIDFAYNIHSAVGNHMTGAKVNGRMVTFDTPLKNGDIVEGIDNCLVKFAKCCTPVPGDPVVGFITRGFGVSVHRADCPNASDAKRAEEPGRWIRVDWATGELASYQTALDISAKDRDGLTLDVAMTLSAAKVKTTSLSARSMPDGYATVSIVLEVKNQEELTNVINKLGQIQGVYQVKRASG